MKIVFADCETVGTDPTRHGLWELALIVRDIKTDPGTTAAWTDTEYVWQVRPDLTHADPMALKIGGYYQRCQLASAEVGTATCITPGDELDEMPAARVARDVALLLDGATLAAANVAFDRDFIAAFLRANGQALACDYHLLEMESYAAGALGLAPPWKLDQLLGRVGVAIPEQDRHTALGDARAIRDLFDAASRPAGTWKDGVRWAAAEADAQASGREPVYILDITDHLRLCADNPVRKSVVGRDLAPTVPV